MKNVVAIQNISSKKLYNYYPETIEYHITEALADIAPKKGAMNSVFTNIYAVSKKDKTKATILFYLYLSDVWFYETEHIHMYDYSNIILTLMVNAINSDKSINFDYLNDISNSDIISFLITFITDQFSMLLNQIKTIQVNTVDKKMSYDDLVKHFLKIIPNNKPPKQKTVELYKFILDLHIDNKTIDFNKFKAYSKERFYEKFSSRVLSESDYKQYGSNLEKYVKEKVQTVFYE